VLAQVNPLHHCVELVREAAFGFETPGEDLIRVGVLVVFGLVLWRLAIWRMGKKLVD
jgi:lipooligosaccharide transport system permease protein